MSSNILYNILQFVLLLLLQALVVSQVPATAFVNAYIFPLFIFLLPFETPRWAMLVLGFVAGLALDFFVGIPGMHAGACLLIGFLRPYLISAITPKGNEFETNPNIYAQGPGWFVIYLGLGMLIYLTWFFVIDDWSLHNIFFLLLKIVLSTVVSVMLMIILLYLFSSKKKRRFVS